MGIKTNYSVTDDEGNIAEVSVSLQEDEHGNPVLAFSQDGTEVVISMGMAEELSEVISKFTP
jgi:hypothetical protein